MKRASLISCRGIAMAICIIFIALNASAKIKLPAVISNKMVLQQNSMVPLWGWADPGERITISNNWSGKTITGKSDATGKWKLMMQTPNAGGPYRITIQGTNRIELTDVLIGEVWVCSGQSNMVFSLKGDAYAREEIPKANYPSIRYFSVERQYGNKRFDDCPGSEWVLTSPQTARSYSAVAYYFAKKIHEQMNVPVGIIYSAWGGTPAEAWTPENVMRNDNLLSVYFDRWKSILENAGPDSITYHKAVDVWKKDSVNKKKPGEPKSFYYFKRPWREPAVLFNGMINPVIPYGIKGILWYQGESNVTYADEYAKLLGTMIHSWRDEWNDKGYKQDLPFYIVQLAAYGYDNMEGAARLREAQQEVADKVPNTGIAITMDLGDMNNIHYTHKKEVGERLAFIALARDYDNKETVYKGPRFEKASLGNGKMNLRFQSFSLIHAKGGAVGGFEIGYHVNGTDSIAYKPAIATINSDNTVTVWNKSVAEPVAVRYAWLLTGEANLFNEEGLPAEPFRWTIPGRSR